MCIQILVYRKLKGENKKCQINQGLGRRGGQSDIDDEIVYRDYTVPSITLSAGTIGSYADGTTVNVELSGYTAIGISIMKLSHAGAYNPVVQINSTGIGATIYFYRTTSTVYTIPDGDMKVRVVYKKS